MEFYRYNQENTLENTLLTVFSDITCSALKEGVTDEQINALPDYFVRLAKALQITPMTHTKKNSVSGNMLPIVFRKNGLLN